MKQMKKKKMLTILITVVENDSMLIIAMQFSFTNIIIFDDRSVWLRNVPIPAIFISGIIRTLSYDVSIRA
jgi:hypothetical protein